MIENTPLRKTALRLSGEVPVAREPIKALG
jgi:hypothetical protein